MTLHPRSDGSSIILERIHRDASGNNDHQRESVQRMSIAEAEALSDALERAIEEAVNAAAQQRRERLTKAQGELAAARRRVAECLAEVERLSAAKPSPVASATLQAVQEWGKEAESIGDSKPAINPRLTAAEFAPTPGETFTIGVDPEMPEFLRRTA